MKWDEPHPNVKCTTSSCYQWVDSKPYSSTRYFFFRPGAFIPSPNDQKEADCSHLTYRHQEQHLILSIDIGIVHQEQLHHLGGVLPDFGAWFFFPSKPMLRKLLQEELDANEWSFFPVRNIGKTLRSFDCNYKSFQKTKIVYLAFTPKTLFLLPKNSRKKRGFFVDFPRWQPTWWTAVCKGDTRFVSCWFTSARTLRWEKLMEKIVVFWRVLDPQKWQLATLSWYFIGMSASYLCLVYGYHIHAVQKPMRTSTIYKIHPVLRRKSCEKLVDLPGQFPLPIRGLQQFPGQPAVSGPVRESDGCWRSWLFLLKHIWVLFAIMCVYINTYIYTHMLGLCFPCEYDHIKQNWCIIPQLLANCSVEGIWSSNCGC